MPQELPRKRLVSIWFRDEGLVVRVSRARLNELLQIRFVPFIFGKAVQIAYHTGVIHGKRQAKWSNGTI